MRSPNFKYTINRIISGVEGKELILARKLVLSSIDGDIVIMDAKELVFTREDKNRG